MDTDSINNFVAETFSKVVVRKQTLLKKISWKDQLEAAVNAIPYIGGSIAQEMQNYQDYKDSEFFRKYTSYLLGVCETTEKQRQKFADEVTEKAEDYAGNVIAGLVDRLDNINKERILANLTIARIDEKISIEMFFRLSSVLERIPYVDLAKLISYQTPFYDEDGDTELLNSTGVLRPVRFTSEGDEYVLSPLGEKLLRFGLGQEVKVNRIKGTSTGLEWHDISEDSDIQITNS